MKNLFQSVRIFVLSIIAITLLGAGTAPAHATTETITWGGGTLTYQFNVISGNCGSSRNNPEYTFTNFVYTDPLGNRISLPGSTWYFPLDDVPNCPLRGQVHPLTLTANGYTVHFVNDDDGNAIASLFGSIFPKYQVLGVDYAPPGANSTATYKDGFARATSNSVSSTFTNAGSLSVTLNFGGPIGRLIGTSLTAGASGSYSEENDTTRQDSINVSTTLGETVPGPPTSTVGINHDNDIIWVWLNPGLLLTYPSDQNSLVWNGYGFNGADPLNEMDVIYLYVSWLKNPSMMPSDVASRLARTWDTSGIGGLTAADYQSILNADPFAVNPSYNPNTDSNQRFTLEVGENFNYEPATVGTQPVPQTYTRVAGTSHSDTNSTKDTRSVSASVTASLGAFVFFNSATATYTYTSTSQWSNTTTNSTSQEVDITIVPPAATDNYTGPTAIQCWRDNVYGSYMFYGAQ